ncbi:ABC transporter ATP-binding protein [Celeribacter halophilus]|uniref:ABC transporter ATP-binding protein n=1 Tax=Celeribacter halophilus TaxID=576117 RepID=UPI002FCF53D8
MTKHNIEASMDRHFLEVKNLSIFREADHSEITSDICLSLARGETIGIVGESGSGKSLTAKAISGLLPSGVAATGSVSLSGQELMNLRDNDWRTLRGRKLSMLLQDPFTMLNPLKKSGAHISEMLKDDPAFKDSGLRRAEVLRRLAEVGLDGELVAEKMPFELSGGMCQRVAMACALGRDPELLIADEPSTALDVTSQAEIIALLKEMQVKRSMALMLITHDLRLAFSACDRVYVLYAGALLEAGPAQALHRKPSHPYTHSLMLSEPSITHRLDRIIVTEGNVPSAQDVLSQCRFADRCSFVREPCKAAPPQLADVVQGHVTRCIRQKEIQPELDARMAAVITPASTSGTRPEPSAPALISVKNVSKHFGSHRNRMTALNNVSIEVADGESVGIVGGSGSGKTTLGRCIIGLEHASSGSICVNGVECAQAKHMSGQDRATLRHSMQMIFQDPYSTLNPKHTIGRCLQEALRAAPEKLSETAMMTRVEELLAQVGLTKGYAARRPHALSGGERQRVAIARALAVGPRTLICDEPVSALDVSVQAQILNLFRNLQKDLGLSYIFISHDLAVMRQVVDRIYVLHRGNLVEHGTTEEILDYPRDDYTKKLINAVPVS